jgi:Zn-dependent protease
MARPPVKTQSTSRRRNQRSSYFGSKIFREKRVLSFSRIEISHLLIGILLVTLVGLSLTGSFIPTSSTLALSIIFSSSFLLHEIAHKFTAQKNQLWSEFRIVPFGVLLTVLSIISPLKIIAPGTVLIFGESNQNKLGKISFAGPLTNIILGYLLLLTSLLYTIPEVALILFWGAEVNAILAIFNLIPFGMLDGQKILLWNKKIWISSFVLSISLLLINRIL